MRSQNPERHDASSLRESQSSGPYAGVFLEPGPGTFQLRGQPEQPGFFTEGGDEV
jgi:hypothetical protein